MSERKKFLSTDQIIEKFLPGLHRKQQLEKASSEERAELRVQPIVDRVNRSLQQALGKE